MMHRIIALALVVLLAAAGCAAAPSQAVTAGETLLVEGFDKSTAWENYEQEGVSLSVTGGAYRAFSNARGYIWGLNAIEHTDVVIQVLSRQISTEENNAYGVICRADVSNNGDGYYFLISGDGYYSIAKGTGENVEALVGWTTTNAVNKGQGNNVIRAVCLGDYLGLFVNETFVGEARDSTFSTGYAGLAVAPVEEGSTVEINFDDLQIQRAVAGSS